MEFEVTKSADKTTVKVKGKIDSNTVYKLEEGIHEEMLLAKTMAMDFSELEYISSAGARLLLMIQKKMNKRQGNLVIMNCNKDVLDVFEKTGFTQVLTII